MSVAQTKSKAPKAAPSPILKSQFEASIAELSPYKFPTAVIEDVEALANVTALDLKGMAEALWCMSYADGGTTGFCGGGLLEGLKWVERELTRKAEHIERVAVSVMCEINKSRLNGERGPL